MSQELEKSISQYSSLVKSGSLPINRTQSSFFQHLTSAEVVYQTKQKSPKIVGQYILGETIGQGSYGKVKEAINLVTLKRVAIKIMRTRRLRKIPRGEENVKKEISLLKKLKHENIVELFEVLFDDEKGKMYIVLEYCQTSLEDLLSEQQLSIGQLQK